MIFNRRVLAAVLTTPVLLLAGCGDDPAPASAPAPAPASAEAAPAVAAGERVGAAGSACELPVEFDMAADWTAKPVTVKADDPLAELARRGPVTMACEIDAKPAGNIGFLRVWTADETGARRVLEEYVGDKAQQPAYTDVRLGGKNAVEVTYEIPSQLGDGTEKEQAFAVETGAGTVIVSLDSFDNDEHAAMLPAYDLAKETLATS